MMIREIAKGSSITRVYKFSDPDGEVCRLAQSGAPIDLLLKLFTDKFIEVKVVEGNKFLNEGINHLWRLARGDSGLTPFGSNSCIGVGDGATPESAGQTGLLGENQLYKGMDTGYPTISATSIIFQSTFGPNDANWTWYEWTVANGPGNDYINLNRKVENLGTKSSGATWILQVTLTIT